jgi:hypothetical protein
VADKEIAWIDRIIIARDGPRISERYEPAKNGGLRLPYICDTRARVTGWDAAPAFHPGSRLIDERVVAYAEWGVTSF